MHLSLLLSFLQFFASFFYSLRLSLSPARFFFFFFCSDLLSRSLISSSSSSFFLLLILLYSLFSLSVFFPIGIEYGGCRDSRWRVFFFVKRAEDGFSGSWWVCNEVDERGGLLMKDGDFPKSMKGFARDLGSGMCRDGFGNGDL